MVSSTFKSATASSLTAFDLARPADRAGARAAPLAAASRRREGDCTQHPNVPAMGVGHDPTKWGALFGMDVIVGRAEHADACVRRGGARSDLPALLERPDTFSATCCRRLNGILIICERVARFASVRQRRPARTRAGVISATVRARGRPVGFAEWVLKDRPKLPRPIHVILFYT